MTTSEDSDANARDYELAESAEEEEHERASKTVDPEMPAADDQMMDSLRSHVPITLLMDLSNPDGPHSEEISHEEGGDADWLDLGDGEQSSS